MMDWFLICFGAGLGSVFRFEIGRRMAALSGSYKISGTFAVNITGALLLGIVVGMHADGLWWSFLADGFLGGFTTFSTLMVEGVQMVKDNRKINVLLYFTSTTLLGILAFLLGNALIGLIWVR